MKTLLTLLTIGVLFASCSSEAEKTIEEYLIKEAGMDNNYSSKELKLVQTVSVGQSLKFYYEINEVNDNYTIDSLKSDLSFVANYHKRKGEVDDHDVNKFKLDRINYLASQKDTSQTDYSVYYNHYTIESPLMDNKEMIFYKYYIIDNSNKVVAELTEDEFESEKFTDAEYPDREKLTVYEAKMFIKEYKK